MNFDLPMIEKRMKEFVAERDWDQYHTIKNLSMAMTKEAAELMELFQWKKEEELKTLPPELKAKLEDEISDVLFYLLRIAQKGDVNLQEAFLNKMKKNEAKYPADKVKGSMKKYNEY